MSPCCILITSVCFCFYQKTKMQFLRSGLDRKIGLIFFCPDLDCPSLAICLKALIFTARCYASAVLAMACVRLCLCLCLSVCLSVCHKSEFY